MIGNNRLHRMKFEITLFPFEYAIMQLQNGLYNLGNSEIEQGKTANKEFRK